MTESHRSEKASFRHRPKHKVLMWHRPCAAPEHWRVVDFGGPHRSGRVLPSPGTRQMELLRLVLDAGNIPYFITGHGSNMRAFVPPLFEKLARAELAEAFAEKSPPPAPEPRKRRNAHWALFVLIVLIFWHGIRMDWWSLPLAHTASPEAWIKAGSLNVTLVRAGEWWRTATALTLHANSLHLFSNVAFSAPFLILLTQRMGMGISLSATVFSGMLANALDVLYRDPGYSSLGASTAMFSVVGLLCADIVIRSPSIRGIRRLALPMAAGMSFLALLGTEGENIDYAAHIFGLLCGFLTGLAVSSAVRHDAVSRPLEILLTAAVPVFLAFCWILAF